MSNKGKDYPGCLSNVDTEDRKGLIWERKKKKKTSDLRSVTSDLTQVKE